ncbi:hypothetical protein PAXRUDRAFT_356400 [Paxillus rubicundulus Ve08.2h10]|uniref:Unplaced genomic scaffold scaffold_1996, whole genome shotgun sequence n=1 Tax=Paxillus rubicundulus Ve08.2h10 TaxID=930991 RepID=A0A0D0D2R6_9AGAM|nr:hypothetical protein PAXRUDRAFT_356400 [Paxillus rubicundulus Ve08.2h10]
MGFPLTSPKPESVSSSSSTSPLGFSGSGMPSASASVLAVLSASGPRLLSLRSGSMLGSWLPLELYAHVRLEVGDETGREADI